MESTTSKENIYLSLINKCHIEIDQIGKKTDIMRSIVDEKIKDSAITRNVLERELEQLLSHLVDLKNSIIN